MQTFNAMHLVTETCWYNEMTSAILARSTIPHFDLSHLTLRIMGSSRFWLKAADEESRSIPHEFPRSHWLKATGQCVLERYLSATMDLCTHDILFH